MPDILHQITIQAPPEEVYAAITEEDGLSSWWTSDVDAEPEEGTQAKFRFEGGMVAMLMRIDRLQPGRAVEWSVDEPSPPEWEGTRVTWQLTPTDEGTELLFGHRGWESTDGAYPSINYNWSYYLTSLKQYLETGEGFPHAG